MRGLVGLVAAVSLLVAAPAANAAPQDVANDISMQVMSPFCPGVTLHDCATANAVELRDRIVEMVEEGFTRAQIIDFIENEYGVTTRATPDPGGTGIVVWLLPGLAALGGAVVAWHFVRRWARIPATPEGNDPAVHITDADRRRLDAELRRFRGQS
ncbi:MAG: cytochrome c-type biogenesis protein [Actinomycetota bacterium]